MFLRAKLILEVSSPDRLPSRSISFGTSSLIHKSFNNSMEDKIVVVASFR